MFERLNERERLIVVGGGGILLLVVLILASFKIGQMRQDIRDLVAQRRDEVSKMKRIRDDLNALPQADTGWDVTRLLTATTNLLKEHNLEPQEVRDRTESGSRTENVMIVEVSLSGAQLQSVLDFIYDVEYGNKIPARIGTLTFRKPLPNREMYDVKLSLMIRTPKDRPTGAAKNS